MNFQNINTGCLTDEAAEVNTLRQGPLTDDYLRSRSAMGSTVGSAKRCSYGPFEPITEAKE